MSYKTSSSAFYGQEPFVAIVLSIGETVYTWATHDISVPSVGMFDGRIIDPGVIDREAVTGRPAGADITMNVSNHDGALDALVADFANNSFLKGSATFYRGFIADGAEEIVAQATLDLVSITGYSDSRLVTLNLNNEHGFLSGTIEPPTVEEVLAALKVADPTNFPASVEVNPSTKIERVPIITGSPHAILKDSGWATTHIGVLTHSGLVGTLPAFNAPVLFGGISKYGFNIYAGMAEYNGAIFRADGVVRAHSADFVDPTVFLSTFAAQSKTITLNGETWHVLLLKAEQFGFTGFSDGTVVLETRPQAKPEGVSDPRPWTMAETIQGVFESGTGNEGAWGPNIVTADWATLSSSTDLTARYKAIQDTDVMDAIGTVTSEAFIDTYVSKTAKFGVVNITPVGGFIPDYSDKILFSEEKNITSFSVSYPRPGSRWGVATRVLVGWSDKPGAAGDGIKTLEVGGLKYVFGEFGTGPGNKTWVSQNLQAETASGKNFLVSLGGFTVPGLDAAKTVGDRCLALRAVPRSIINITATIEATQVELGDVVRVKHSAAPWSGEHVGIVYGIADDLQTHTTQLTIVDLNGYLLGATFIYNTGAAWTHADTTYPNAGATISITNGSNTVTASAVDTFDGVLTGDILRIDEGDNHFEVIIASTDQDSTLTTENGGGGYGLTNSEYVTDGSITGWSILRSQATRETTPAKAAVAITDVFGAYANDDDDLFLDDTAPYRYD